MPDVARRLVLVRHAKAQEPAGGPDHERPLTEHGSADARALGRWLKERRIVPDTVLCSTALRARQTWAAAAETGTLGAVIEHDRRIYNAGVPQLVQVVQEVDADDATVVVVGHAPGLPALAAWLSEGQPGADELDAGFPTCTAAILEVGTPWADLAAGVAAVQVVHAARRSGH